MNELMKALSVDILADNKTLEFREWIEMIDDIDLNLFEFRILFRLGLQSAGIIGAFSISAKAIAHHCKISEETTIKHIIGLEKKGLIRIIRIDGEASRFILPVRYNPCYEKSLLQCTYCGKATDLTIDHIIPKAKNGANSRSNYTIACKRCNSSKGAKIL